MPNPYHKGKGGSGGQFTTEAESGMTGPSSTASFKKANYEVWAKAHPESKVQSGEQDPYAKAYEAEMWAQNVGLGEDAKKLTPEERNAIKAYADSDNEEYKIINSSLRHPEDWPTGMVPPNMIAPIDSGLAKTSTPRDLTLYRSYNPNMQIPLKVGSTINDKAFWSTSLSRSVAQKFSADYEQSSMFRINLPQGSKGLYLGDITYHTEAEVLLPRDSKFKVVTVTQEPAWRPEIIAKQKKKSAIVGITPEPGKDWPMNTVYSLVPVT
jgi:hypothetical protein